MAPPWHPSSGAAGSPPGRTHSLPTPPQLALIRTDRVGGRILSGGRAERTPKQCGGEQDAAGPVSAPFALQPVLAHGMELGRRRQRCGTGRAQRLHNCCRGVRRRRRRRRGCEEPRGQRLRDLEVSAPRWVRNRAAGGAQCGGGHAGHGSGIPPAPWDTRGLSSARWKREKPWS